MYVSMRGRGPVWSWMIEFSGVALSCRTFVDLQLFPDLSIIKPEDTFSPLFKLNLYSMPWVGTLVS